MIIYYCFFRYRTTIGNLWRISPKCLLETAELLASHSYLGFSQWLSRELHIISVCHFTERSYAHTNWYTKAWCGFERLIKKLYIVAY